MLEIITKNDKKKYDEYVEKEFLLPVKVSDFYMKKVIDEVQTIGIGGPLYLSVIPTMDKLCVRSSVEARDYVEEYNHMPVPEADYIIQKYDDRVLVIITEICFSHCQYCFRTYNLSNFLKSNRRETIKEKITVLKEYLLRNTKIKEVILSGGDPLSIDYDNLVYILSELRYWNIRIHTRAIVYNPYVFSDEIVKLFHRSNVRLVFHINHPYEICEVVRGIIEKLNFAGVKLYAQFPLLRGINDNPLVLRELLIMMDDLHIRPISIFVLDPINYSASFRVRFDRIMEIVDELNWKTPSWINSVRLVLDTPYGKVRRENIINREGNCITFFREGHYINYYDLDDGIDVPTDVKKLLWKSTILY